jgi:hypothetical protein
VPGIRAGWGAAPCCVPPLNLGVRHHLFRFARFSTRCPTFHQRRQFERCWTDSVLSSASVCHPRHAPASRDSRQLIRIALQTRRFARKAWTSRQLTPGLYGNAALWSRPRTGSSMLLRQAGQACARMMPNKRLERTVTHKVQGAPRHCVPRRWLITRSLLRPAAQPRR